VSNLPGYRQRTREKESGTCALHVPGRKEGTEMNTPSPKVSWIEFNSSWGMGADYMAHMNDGSYFRLRVLAADPGEYFRSIYNGNDEQWKRDVLGKVGRYDAMCEDITPAIHESFMRYLTERAQEPREYIPSYWDNGWHTYDWYEVK